MMNDNPFLQIPNISLVEVNFLTEISQDLNINQKKDFAILYSSKRRDPQHILIFTLLGFIGIAGLHRFATNRIGLGIIYFFTAGLFFIGTIVDLLNYKKLANNYNRQMALESRSLINM